MSVVIFEERMADLSFNVQYKNAFYDT